MQIHRIKSDSKNKKGRRVARGGKRGGYSGRGIKGQKSRAGAKIRPAIRDAMSKFPKQRGRAKHSFRSLFEKPVVLNLRDLNKAFKDGEIVNVKTLIAKGLVYKSKGKHPEVKILSGGEIAKKLSFGGVLLSRPARDKIIKAKGAIK